MRGSRSILHQNQGTGKQYFRQVILVFGLRMREHDRAGLRHGIEVAHEAFWFWCRVRSQIVRPAETDRLVPEFDLDLKRTLRAAEIDRVAHLVACGCEIRVVGSIADDGNVFVRGLLFESGRQKAIVLEISYSRSQARGHAAFAVFQDGLVDLDLVASGDLPQMRLKPRRFDVVNIALDCAVGLQRSGFEHQISAAISNSEMQPGAPRRERCGQLVTGQVFDEGVSLESAAAHVDIANTHARSLSLQEIFGAFGLGGQLFRQSRYAQLVTMKVE